LASDDVEQLYQEIVAAAVKLTRSIAGTMQVFNDETNELELLASAGIPPVIKKRFARVGADSGTSCGVALRSGKRSYADYDDPNVRDPKGANELHRKAGLLCSQSTVLLSRTGKCLGMISTHWGTHKHRLTEREQRFLDLLARQSADLLEARLSGKALIESDQRLRVVVGRDLIYKRGQGK